MKLILETMVCLLLVHLALCTQAQSSYGDKICQEISAGSDSESLIQSILSKVTKEKFADQQLTKPVMQQNVARFMYGLHRSLLDSCEGYPLKMFPYFGYTLVDLEGIFSKGEIDSLESIIRDLSAETRIHLTIGTIKEFYPYRDIEEFGINALAKWGYPVNNKPKILILLSIQQRQIFIIGNEFTSEFLSSSEREHFAEKCSPEFKRGQYYNGINKGLKYLCMVLK
jgi:hypothetical protein